MKFDDELIDPTVLIPRARQWIERLQCGSIDSSQLSKQLSQILSTRRNAQMFDLKRHGELKNVELVGTVSNSGNGAVYRFNVTFSANKLLFDIGILQSGVINQFSFRPFPAPEDDDFGSLGSGDRSPLITPPSNLLGAAKHGTATLQITE